MKKIVSILLGVLVMLGISQVFGAAEKTKEISAKQKQSARRAANGGSVQKINDKTPNSKMSCDDLKKAWSDELKAKKK
ncbi:hypothetical protein ACFLQ1_01775 [Candidatus Auribacterota bacterium]